jgi:hypothetical protein
MGQTMSHPAGGVESPTGRLFTGGHGEAAAAGGVCPFVGTAILRQHSVDKADLAA